MNYYFEVWLRGFAKDTLRSISTKDPESYHPHVTLVRPFGIVSTEDVVREKVSEFCRGRKPVFFSLEGKGTFEGGFYYVPVVNGKDLLQFNNRLEQVLNDHVTFAPKLDDEKKLHATVDVNQDISSCPKVDQCMLRLTGIKDKRIWFSYDFVTQEILNREDSLDKSNWYRTIHEFTKQYGFLPTRQGYKKF